MSLNGLDAAAVKEAYEAAVAEPGGWYVMCNLSSHTGRIPHPRACASLSFYAMLCYAMLCNLVHLVAEPDPTSNCAVPSLTPPTVPAYRFLLKYTSRDEVDVLAKGNGGTVDMRNNIAQYEETSPLFGLLRYRRRNVIIKYLPEGCSRLIQGMSQAFMLRCPAPVLSPDPSPVPLRFTFRGTC